MPIMKRADSFLDRYSKIVPISRLLSPLFRISFYIALVLSALLVMISVILIFVQVEVRDMLLPPTMSMIKDDAGAITQYSLNFGNGIKIIQDADIITLGHIKTVIYCQIATYFVTLLTLAPIFYFLSKMFKNVGKANILNEENAKYVNYIGLIILIGNTLVIAVKNIFNYLQINKFLEVGDTKIQYAFQIEWFGIVIGLFIITIGTVYGYACSVANRNAPPMFDNLPVETDK